MKAPVLESLYNKVAGLMACNFIKKRLQQRCYSVNIEKFLRTSILKSICERLLLCMQILVRINLVPIKKKMKTDSN